MRVFVTGSSGFIGTNVMNYFLANDIPVIGFDVKDPQNINHSKVFIKGSLLDKDELSKALVKFSPTHIVHLGARTDLDGKHTDDYAENVQGLNNLISICDVLPDLQRVLFASSRLVCKIGYTPKDYDDYCPTTPYGESKVMGEKIVKSMSDKKWTWCIFRPTSIWGEWFGVPYRNFFDLVRAGKYFHPTGITIPKSFGYVGNVVHEIYRLCVVEDSKINKRCFYSGDYNPIEVFDFSRKIAKSFGVKTPGQVSIHLLKLLAKIGDLLLPLGIRFPLTSFRLANILTPMIHDFSDLEAVVGPLPYTVDQGIEKTVEWMRRA